MPQKIQPVTRPKGKVAKPYSKKKKKGPIVDGAGVTLGRSPRGTR